MEAVKHYPNVGKIPMLDALPLALQLPVAKLGQIKGVETVVATSPVPGINLVQVVFKYHKKMKQWPVLKCFGSLVPIRMEINTTHHYIILEVKS
jgi:hypothetical protein